MKGIKHDTIREATSQDPLYCHTVYKTCDSNDEIHWQIHSRILYHREKGDADCIYILPTTYSNRLNVRDDIMCLTHQELAHFGPNKCY
jgi:hypothetical protein